jgi:hypothetical protein
MNATTKQLFRSGLFSGPVFAHARHKARYSHRTWIVWQEWNVETNDRWATAPLSAETIERAINSLESHGQFSIVSPGGGATNVGKGLAKTMLKNARNGHL